MSDEAVPHPDGWPVLPAGAPRGPVLVHCDARQTHPLVRDHPAVRRHPARAAVLAAHLEVLDHLAGGRPLWLPAFNYDYCRGEPFDLAHTASQVGPITEHFRRSAAWRSAMPVFSVCGTGAPFPGAAPGDGELDPFGDRSAFAALAEADGVIVWYGAPLSSTTMIHHAERSAGGPLYRYDKHFDGLVSAAGRQHRTSLRYHVRPWGRHLDYDWPRLADDLATHGILQPLRPELGVSWASARALRTHWVGALSADPLALLDTEARGWVEPLLDRLGRRFEHRDFEPEAPSEMAS